MELFYLIDYLLHIATHVFCAHFTKMKRSQMTKIFLNGLLMFTYCLLFIFNTNCTHFFFPGVIQLFSMGLVIEFFLSKYLRNTKNWDCGTKK